MKIKFKTFRPWVERTWQNIHHSATDELNKWLEENSDAEIISWQTTSVGNYHELYITIQYRVFEEN